MKFLAAILFVIFFTVSYSQSKLEKWGKAEISYSIPDETEERIYSFAGDDAGEVFSKSFINTYRFFISDIDGDNCPFHPSCSGFFIQAVKETNVLQGMLMFADRFTRDMNFVNRNKKYTQHKSGKYYDPPFTYSLK